jgi:nitrite reductase (NADH) small subunit
VARTRVAETKDIGRGAGLVVDAGGQTLALFNVGGRFYAIHNSCPHRGGPLGHGRLHDAIVTCPWHGYRYDVRTGAHQRDASFNVPCFPVTVEAGVIYVDV